MAKDNSGAAFPCPVDVLGRDMNGGMTLRDYFAGQALAGLCANSAFDDTFNGNGQGHAKFAYKFADAMMEARK